MADLIKSFFEPKTAAAILIALGVFTALYAAAIKFFAPGVISRRGHANPSGGDQKSPGNPLRK